MALCRAVSFTTAPELLEVTPEQVGILKAMKIAVEYEKFLQKLEAGGPERLLHRGAGRRGHPSCGGNCKRNVVGD